MRRQRLASAILILLLTPALAPAQVIDDFEQGSFNLSGNSFTSGLQQFLLPIHCITSERIDRMFINGSLSGADLNLVNVDNQVATVWGNDGGRLEFEYDLAAGAGADLSFGGLMDALRVQMPIAVPAGELEIQLRDSGGSVTASATRQITGPMAYSIPLAEFAGVDIGDIVYIQLALDVPDFGDYHISDFRAWDDPSIAADMDVSVGNVSGPPYPTAPIQIIMNAKDGSGSSVETEILSLSLTGAVNNEIDPETQLVAMDSGGGIGMPGEQVGIIIVNSQPAPAKKAHFRTWDSRWDLRGSGEFTTVLAGLPELHLPSPGMPAEWAHMKWTTYSHDGDGVPRFRTDYELGVGVEPGMGLSLVGMGIEPQPFMPASFDVFFEVDVILGKASLEGIGENILNMQLNAAVTDIETSTAAPHWTGGSLALWAQPNVMSASTQLWMSRALDREVQLRLFDLAGRAVRTLRVPAGQEFTTWDGRDGRGAVVGSGMYLLRAMDAPNSGSAKIVKLR